MLDQIAAPCGKVGPVWINLAPNLAKTTEAQGVELGAHRQNAHAQRDEIVAFGLPITKENRQSIGFIKRCGEFGKPVRSGTRDGFG
jgi:hypothetical protein